MMIKNTKSAYGAVHKALHWLIAIVIIGLIAVGIYMEGMERSPEKFELYGLHKSFGVMALGLVLVRLLWRLVNTTPRLPEGMRMVEKAGAHLGHLSLYIMMFAMPISGWVMSSSAGYPVKFFGYELPAIVGKNPEINDIAHTIHGIGGNVFIALIVLHVLAALWHHFVKKDDVLKRMV